MLSRLTDSTCEFGLARTGDVCDRTLASFDMDAYTQARVLYLAVGSVMVAVTGFLAWRARRNECATLQQRSLALCLFASLTFAARATDPRGYNHIVPRPIVILLSSSCTAALYSIYILSLVYWATIIQQGAGLELPPRLRWLLYTSLSGVWAFYALLSASSFLSKGFYTTQMTIVEMAGSSGFLLFISVAFMFYGLRVMRRLRDFERLYRQQEHLDRLRRQAGAAMSIDDSPSRIDSSRVAKTAFVEEGEHDQPKAKLSSHATRIRKILLVVEVFAFVAIVAQLYVGITVSSKPLKELDCANGLTCSHVHCSVSILHWFQAGCIGVITWVFRNTGGRARTASAATQA